VLTVNEIFHSIQGESTHAGRPCVFVRLTACDLRCSWCDTPYAFHEGRKMTIDEVVAAVDRHGCPLVEITGGEPLLQDDVYPLMERLLAEGRTVMLETGGHRPIARVPRDVVKIVDVKCPGSGEADRNEWRNLDALAPHDEVKFVVKDRADYEYARDVIARDRDVNAYENEIDEKCVELLALHQPAASDLRFITTAMKIVTDLERIGDQAVNIAQRALELNREPQLKPYMDLPRMAEKAQAMMKESLDAFVARDTALARRVRGEDEAVDALNHQIFRELLTFMMEDPTTITRAIRLILIARFLERVADHATNIAEMVIYLVESKIVRHTVG